MSFTVSCTDGSSSPLISLDTGKAFFFFAACDGSLDASLSSEAAVGLMATGAMSQQLNLRLQP